VGFEAEHFLKMMTLCELKQLNVHEALNKELAHEQTERSEGAREPNDERVGVDAQRAWGDEVLKTFKGLKKSADKAYRSPHCSLQEPQCELSA
jgi:hypothetical protein